MQLPRVGRWARYPNTTATFSSWRFFASPLLPVSLRSCNCCTAWAILMFLSLGCVSLLCCSLVGGSLAVTIPALVNLSCCVISVLHLSSDEGVPQSVCAQLTCWELSAA